LFIGFTSSTTHVRKIYFFVFLEKTCKEDAWVHNVYAGSSVVAIIVLISFLYACVAASINKVHIVI
jgi:hypothetical protein